MKICTYFFIIVLLSIAFISHPETGFCESFDFSQFSKAYGQDFGSPDYDPIFDFNRDNNIDSDDFPVFLQSTPFRSLLPFLKKSLKSSGKNKKGSSSESDSNDEENLKNHLDIDKDGDVDSADVNLMQNVLNVTQMISTTFQLPILTITVNTAPEPLPLVSDLHMDQNLSTGAKTTSSQVTVFSPAIKTIPDIEAKQDASLSLIDEEKTYIHVELDLNVKNMLTMDNVKDLIDIYSTDTGNYIASNTVDLKQSENKDAQSTEVTAEQTKTLENPQKENRHAKSAVDKKSAPDILDPGLSIILDKNSMQKNYDRVDQGKESERKVIKP